MSTKAFSFFVTAGETSKIDAIVAEAIRITPEASHFVPKWYQYCQDGLMAVCDATPNEVKDLLDDLAIFEPLDMSIKWLITDIAKSYISDVASHAFD